MIEQIIHSLVNGRIYYGKVFTMNAAGRINNRADLPVFTVIPSLFPEQPEKESDYTLISDFTSTQTFTAPEDGWFLIEVHGASGNGGGLGISSVSWYITEDDEGERMYGHKTGGSGAGGGYGASIVKLKKGDAVQMVIGRVGEATSAAISSTAGESYAQIVVEPGGSGANASNSSVGSAGLAGAVSGGNLYNLPGSNGKSGGSNWAYSRDDVTVAARAGGLPGHADGNQGGASSGCTNGTRYAAGSGRAGFVRVSRGRTNVVTA